MKKPRSEKPCPQSEPPLTYRTRSAAAETRTGPQSATELAASRLQTPTSAPLRLATTDALSGSGVAQNGRNAPASLPGGGARRSGRPPPVGAKGRKCPPQPEVPVGRGVSLSRTTPHPTPGPPRGLRRLGGRRWLATFAPSLVFGYEKMYPKLFPATSKVTRLKETQALPKHPFLFLFFNCIHF